MINVAVSTIIHRPIAEVFPFVANFENHPQWESNFQEVKRLSPDLLGVGTRYECVLNVPGQRVVSTFEITEYEPNRRIAFHGDRPALAKPVGSMMFESVAGGTQVTLIPRPEFSGIFKLLEPLMARYIQKQNTEHLRRLKQILET